MGRSGIEWEIKFFVRNGNVNQHFSWNEEYYVYYELVKKEFYLFVRKVYRVVTIMIFFRENLEKVKDGIRKIIKITPLKTNIAL